MKFLLKAVFVFMSVLIITGFAQDGMHVDNGAALRRGGVPSSQGADDATRSSVLTRFLRSPLHFIANQGQMDEAVFYCAKSQGATVYCTDQGLTFGFAEGSISLKFSEERRIRPEARGELPAKIDYFIGSDLASWRTNVLTFGEIVYRSVYPGIDLVYGGDQRRLKYTFYVQPGADPDQIKMTYEGVEHIRVDEATGELIIGTEWGEIRDAAPVAYQEIDGVRRDVDIRFRMKGKSSVGFAIGNYDEACMLALDPMYSTYLGGDGWDVGLDIAVDSSGNAYVTGTTDSTSGFPIQNAFQESHGGGDWSDAFVTKLAADGSLVYSTYLGGAGIDEGEGIAVDSSGNAYVTGITMSTPTGATLGFPIQNAFQENHGGGLYDAFVTKLSASGSLAYSTYLGGDSGDKGVGIAADSSGNAYVTGFTHSTSGFPIQNAFQESYGGRRDAFVTKLSADGSLAYSTYLGGDHGDCGFGIAADSSGNAYVTGVTVSTSSFPIQNALQENHGGGWEDAFVTKLSVDGSLLYSTYLGGDNHDYGKGIAADSSGNAYVTGYTSSTSGFPIQNAFQENYNGWTDAFVTKLLADGSLLYSTYLGGDNRDYGEGIAVDSSRNAYVTGRTKSTSGFPIKNAFQASYGGGSDAFVTSLTAGGSLLYSTYLGGGDIDWGTGIAVDSSGNAYVTGWTKSTSGFPIQNAFQENYNGWTDAFVTKLLTGSVVEMEEGWNLFSFPTNECFYEGTPPTDQPACVVMVDVVNDLSFGSLSEWFDSIITPVNPVTDPWRIVIGTNGVMDSTLSPSSHSLKYMTVTAGYWVKIEDAAGGANLPLSGALFDPGCAIPLLDGWSIISYPLSTGYYDTDDPPTVPGVTNWAQVPRPVGAHVFASIAGKYRIIIGQQGVYDPALSPESSSLRWIAPCTAYWIKMDEPWDLVYGNMGTAATSLALASPPMNQTITGSGVTPSNTLAVVYGSLTRDGIEADVGAHVQVFAQSGALCGETKVTHPGQYGMTLVYGDDSLTPQIEGARLGEELIFHINGNPAQAEDDVYWLGDRSVQRVDLVCRSRPQVSMLAQNYPNPFNPETWIPYQLSKDAHVEIKIYTSTGQLVRTLNLGRKPSGFYTSKKKAAYWDGRNEVGEHVASGIYFYSIKAGILNATRKMVITE